MTPAVARVRGGAPAPPPSVIPDEPLDLLADGAVVAVAMSGGVDSSVAAARVAASGARCFGITLAMWPRDRTLDRDRGCCSVDAVEDARRVCATLDMPHYAWNLEAGFRAAVIDDFEAEYAAGRTPNPCVRCNERVKFGDLLERALSAGATHLATGHYARIGRRLGRPTLHRALALDKDQSYTLHRVDATALGHAVFPLGSMPDKAAVRAEAGRLGLAVAAKPDSQELCFVDGRLRDDLARRLRGRFAPGDVVDGSGAVVGTHPGLPFVTIGQRSGLSVPPRRPDTASLHVVRLDASANRVVVGDREALRRSDVTAADCRWVDGPPPVGAVVGAQLRAHGDETAVTVTACDGATVSIHAATPVTAVAPGQSMVLLRDGEVLGGGIVVSDR